MTMGITTKQAVDLTWPGLIILLVGFYLCLRKSCGLNMLVACLIGIIVGNYRVNFRLVGREILQDYQGQTVIIVGKLSEEPDTSKGKVALRVKDLQLCTQLEADLDAPELCDTQFLEIAGTMYISLSSAEVELERSDEITLQGKLGEGFGTFVASMYRPKLLAVERASPGDIFARVKRWFAEAVRQVVPSPEVDLGLGYLMGMKTGLSEEFSEALSAVGMTHVVVASGAHLAILVGAARKTFGKISKFAGLMVGLMMIGSFVMIVGFTPSMTRAALVASLSLLVGYVGRNFTPLRLISFVAMLTLLIDPTNFLSLAWQLSFASFFGILVLGSRLQKLFYGGKQPPWLASMLLTSLSTCLVCAPILIYNFGSLSLLAFVANLIILPTLPYAMLLMLLCGIVSFWPALASLVALPTQWLLDLHIWVVNFLSEKTMFILEFELEDPKVYAIYIIVLMILLWPTLVQKYQKYRKKITPKVTQAYEFPLEE